MRNLSINVEKQRSQPASRRSNCRKENEKVSALHKSGETQTIECFFGVVVVFRFVVAATYWERRIRTSNVDEFVFKLVCSLSTYSFFPLNSAQKYKLKLVEFENRERM